MALRHSEGGTSVCQGRRLLQGRTGLPALLGHLMYS